MCKASAFQARTNLYHDDSRPHLPLVEALLQRNKTSRSEMNRCSVCQLHSPATLAHVLPGWHAVLQLRAGRGHACSWHLRCPLLMFTTPRATCYAGSVWRMVLVMLAVEGWISAACSCFDNCAYYAASMGYCPDQSLLGLATLCWRPWFSYRFLPSQLLQLSWVW